MSEFGSERGQRQGAVLRELLVVHQLTATRLTQALRPLGISLTHVSFLSHLAGTGASSSVSDIAAAMEVNQPAVSKTMKTLAELNAITVQNDAGDARRRIVHLTAAGSDLLSRARALMHPVADLTFDPLTDRRLDQLLDTLTRIRTRLDTARR